MPHLILGSILSEGASSLIFLFPLKYLGE